MRVMKRSKLKRPEFVQKRRGHQLHKFNQVPKVPITDRPILFGILAFVGSSLVIVVLSLLII